MVFLFEKKLWVTLATAFFVLRSIGAGIRIVKVAKYFLRIVLISAVAALLAPSNLYAAHGPEKTRRLADEEYHLAVALEKRGNYYDAVTEYKRFLFFLPGEKRTPEVLFRLARCYYELHDWKNTLKYARVFCRRYPDHPLEIGAKLLEARALINKCEPQKALEILNEIRNRHEKLDPEVRDTIMALTGRCYVLEGNLSKARKLAGEQAESVYGAHLKNPWFAGISAAVLPGAGHVYDGRPRDGWTAFFYTGILSAITWEAVENDNLWLAGVFGSAASMFYAGNIFSAVNMAYKHNRRLEATALNSYLSQKSGDILVNYDLLPVKLPEKKAQRIEKKAVKQKKSPFAWMFVAGISVFRKMVSPVDNKHCPSYPSCSTYALLAFKKHGAFWGAMLTVDRLIHESSEAKFSPYIYIRGNRKIYDPLEANDFLLK